MTDRERIGQLERELRQTREEINALWRQACPGIRPFRWPPPQPPRPQTRRPK